MSLNRADPFGPGAAPGGALRFVIGKRQKGTERCFVLHIVLLRGTGTPPNCLKIPSNDPFDFPDANIDVSPILPTPNDGVGGARTLGVERCPHSSNNSIRILRFSYFRLARSASQLFGLLQRSSRLCRRPPRVVPHRAIPPAATKGKNEMRSAAGKERLGVSFARPGARSDIEGQRCDSDPAPPRRGEALFCPQWSHRIRRLCARRGRPERAGGNGALGRVAHKGSASYGKPLFVFPGRKEERKAGGNG